jgi:hypothetical protein
MKTMTDERIAGAERPLLLQLTPAAEGTQTFSAEVYVLAASKEHEWVPVEGTLTVDGAADLFAELHERDERVKIEVAIAQWQRGDWPARDAMLAAFTKALWERGLSVTDEAFTR